MYGSLSEFTLAQVLQFFALAERSGTVTVSALDRQSRLLVEGDRIIGWGLEGFDVRESLAECELLPAEAAHAIRTIIPRADTPGLSFVIRNLMEPERWDAYAQRQLEQDVYPLLSVDEGDFRVEVQRCPPAPLRLSIPINSLILEGSRWESEMEAARIDGYGPDSRWKRTCDHSIDRSFRVTAYEWVIWAGLHEPSTISSLAKRLCIPDLSAIGVVRRLASLGLLEQLDS